MRQKFDELEKASFTIEKGLQVCESEMETLSMKTRTCEAVINGLKKELRGFEKTLKIARCNLKT